jgi:hypothetical protein
VERSFVYTVTNAAANLRVLAFGTGTGAVSVSVFRDCVNNRQAACNNNADGTPIAVANDFRAGDVVTILVEVANAAGTVDLSISEQARTVLLPGDTCDPLSTTTTCDPSVDGLICAGGPSPRAFSCAVPVRADLGGACLAGSTDQVCGTGLGCIDGTCVEVADPGDATDPLRLTLPVQAIPALIDPAGEVDCYGFVVEAPIAFTGQTDGACRTTGVANTFLTLQRVIGRNANGTPLLQGFSVATNDNGTGLGDCSLLNTTIGAGEYMLCLNEVGNDALASGITLSMSGTPRDVNADGNGITFGSPAALTVPGSAAFSVAAGEVDCVAFSIDASRATTVTTAGCTGDTLLNVFDVTAEPFVVGRDDDGGGGVCSRVAATLPAGNYVACVDEFGSDGTASGNIAIQ